VNAEIGFVFFGILSERLKDVSFVKLIANTLHNIYLILLTQFFVGLTHMANQFQVKESRHICGCAKKK